MRFALVVVAAVSLASCASEICTQFAEINLEQSKKGAACDSGGDFFDVHKCDSARCSSAVEKNLAGYAACISALPQCAVGDGGNGFVYFPGLAACADIFTDAGGLGSQACSDGIEKGFQ